MERLIIRTVIAEPGIPWTPRRFGKIRRAA